jgi:hypothetical protein
MSVLRYRYVQALSIMASITLCCLAIVNWDRAAHEVVNSPTSYEISLARWIWIGSSIAIAMSSIATGTLFGLTRYEYSTPVYELGLLLALGALFVALGALQLDNEIALNFAYVIGGISGSSAIWKTISAVRTAIYWKVAFGLAATTLAALYLVSISWWIIYFE